MGGKAALLGELSRIDGISVPDGFCVTTDAFRRTLAAAPFFRGCLARLSRLGPDDREAIRALSAEVREAVRASVIPGEVAAAIVERVTRLGEHAAYAVRSSATGEDSPAASHAGQHDSFLNVVGPVAILEHVRRCWASLFTERAVAYGLHSGTDHGTVEMAVVVQQMVYPEAAGVVFTADPVTCNRRITVVEATFGLGEGLVSSRANADAYRVRDGEIIARSIAVKPLALHASPNGGTAEQAVELERQAECALTDAEVRRLAQLGRTIEARLGSPQDIEWCLAGDGFHIVQSRPITTLFPIPAAGDDAKHVYVSVGHQQMMTDAMRPLGLSVWQHTTPRPMAEAGSRLFVDVAPLLASPARRSAVIGGLGTSDPLIGDALEQVVERGFVPLWTDEETPVPAALAPADPLDPDPGYVQELIAESDASLATLRKNIATRTGPALLDFVLEDLEKCRRDLSRGTRSLQAIRTAMDSARWLNEQMEEWLGERNVADVLTQSAPHNVTAEMGLALMDLADVVRPHASVIAFLERVDAEGLDHEHLLDELAEVPGGPEVGEALATFLERYGMRCVGEIDVTRPRWVERPVALIPLILTNVRTFSPGAAAQRFQAGRRQALAKRDEVLERLRALPDGEPKAEEASTMIARVRTFAGYREYPKYALARRWFIYKQALMAEADRLIAAGALRERDDVFFLRLEELADTVQGAPVDPELLRARKAVFAEHQTLTPPRVFTSEGEVIRGVYRRDDLPESALAGLAVSAGTVEGRARVVLDVAQADLEPGDILVTRFTDPSWTPLFVAVRGVVTEVGGLMTHGAVIAREYGSPAVVGVERATQIIRDKQRIRVHGGDGYVELLP